MNVFELAAKISLDKTEYDTGLKQASRDTQSFGTKIVSGLKTVGRVAIAGVAVASTAMLAIGKKSLSYYSQYEQLVGGVDTLFKRSSMSLEEYAAQSGRSVAEVTSEYSRLNRGADAVMKHASEAYRTAGMSANEYMETVTSFSASLLQSLGGDTVKAAGYADMAIRDMSDNANKMGSDIGSIQAAYSGFAKQNYTMLDNLNTMGALAA